MTSDYSIIKHISSYWPNGEEYSCLIMATLFLEDEKFYFVNKNLFSSFGN